MVPALFVVVVDANVLFPFTLRDTFLRTSAEGFYQLRWSVEILNEMERNLVSSGTTTAEQARRLRTAMETAFPDAMVVGFEPLIAVMPNDAKDRHVAAAAVKANAQVIATSTFTRLCRSRWAGGTATFTSSASATCGLGWRTRRASSWSSTSPRLRSGGVVAVGSRFEYLYDFGDSWSHELVVEKVREQAGDDIVCTGGARACPPEDCGSTPGYLDLLTALGTQSTWT